MLRAATCDTRIHAGIWPLDYKLTRKLSRSCSLFRIT